MSVVSRRSFLTATALGSVAALVEGRRSFAAASPAATDVTLWKLDPEWGTPLTTATGSDTKSRCRGAACRAAAPNRFFLTSADALAGRLHPCCLAQPVAVTACIDLNALMPYYRARLGGVDGRCPELPDELRTALYSAAACLVATPTTTPATGGTGPGATAPSATTTPPSTAVGSGAVDGDQGAAAGGGADPAGAPTTTTTTTSVPGGELPATGAGTGTTVAVATVAAVIGSALVMAASGRDPELDGGASGTDSNPHPTRS